MEFFAGRFVLVFAFVFLWWGWELTEFAFYRTSELAELPLWTIHVIWMVAGLVWILFQAERMARAVALGIACLPVLFLYREMDWKELVEALGETGRLVGAGYFIAGFFLVVGCFLDAIPAIIIVGSIL